MAIACLIPDDAAFDRMRGLLHSAGWDGRRFSTEIALARGLFYERFELVVVDAGGDIGLEKRILAWVGNRTGERAPVVMMCGDSTAQRIARALDAGAEDVVSRWADPLEVAARLRRAVSRLKREPASRLRMGDFLLEPGSQQLFDRGVEVPLTAREFAMAWVFFSNPDTTLSRDTISLAVWGAGVDTAYRTMEQHVYRLRKKLRLHASRGVSIRTLYSQGYRLETSRLFESAPADESAAGIDFAKRTPYTLDVPPGPVVARQ